MARITATENVTLDGVMQGPGRPGEDTRGGFEHSGWADGFSDEVQMKFMSEGMSQTGVMLFGRRTYEDLMAVWTATTEPNPFTEHLVNVQKYVVSRSSSTELVYPNSTLLAGDAAQTVASLKASVDGDISIIGSGELVRSLHAAGLLDAYVLCIYPIILGSGTKLFADDSPAADRANVTLERSVTTSTGVLIGQYLVEARP